MSESEVARLRRQIEMELEAMQRGMTGLAAGTARHEFIQARLNRIDACRNTLAEHVGEVGATRMVYNLYAEIIEG